MIENNHKTSLLVPSQLPEFIRDNPDYSKFVQFLQAYYEWMEQNGKVTERTKNLLNYKDVDKTSDEFIQYYVNDFLPNFPEDALADKRKLIKAAKQLYETKGTPASYQFLFRVLYNSDFDFFNTKEAVFKASSSEWFVAKSLRLASLDSNFANTANYRLFGETSQSIATIENTLQVNGKTEVFISNIERLFQSGEFVRVVDNSNQPILFNGNPLRAKIVGQINQINIDPNNRGLLYEPGNPVIVYGGLSPEVENPIGAEAEVGSTTSGSIQRINVVNGGYGYREIPNTILSITNAPDAVAHAASFDPNGIANTNLIITDDITLSRYTTIGNTSYSFLSNNISANANTSLINAFGFAAFSTFPISSVVVDNGGGGITKVPVVTADSVYPTNVPNVYGNLRNLGILAPIQITNGGTGYQANDQIVFSGGRGYGAYANVITVSGTGAITSVSYVPGLLKYPLGGLGYTRDGLPSLTVNSANTQAANAIVYVPGILGDGATFSVVVDRAGSITTINITNYGEDYIGKPNVSFKIEDIVVSNVSSSTTVNRLDTIYQGANLNVATYVATVDSVSVLAEPYYRLRVFNYNSTPNTALPLKSDTVGVAYKMYNAPYPPDNPDPRYNDNGIRVYGDGNAKGTASFLNGLSFSQGQWIKTQGHPSSYAKLESEKYNNFTYQVTVEKEIAKYRDTLLKLLHPAGTKIIGRVALKSEALANTFSVNSTNKGQTLYYYTGRAASNVTMTTDFTTKSTNIVKFNELGSGVNIAQFIFANSSIGLTPTNGSTGQEVFSSIVSIDAAANTVTLATNTWLTFANVAYVRGNTGSNTINIRSLTGAYDVINNGIYSNTANPLMDIVYAGDQVLVANNTAKTVKSVDYIKGIITLTANLSANANSLMAVNRTFFAGGTIYNANQIKIFGPIGLQYFPELTTESGDTITTEDGVIILLG